MFISVCDADKEAVVGVAARLSSLGFHLLATEGTHTTLARNGIASEHVLKYTEGLALRGLAEEVQAAERAAGDAGDPVVSLPGDQRTIDGFAPLATVVDLIEAGQVDLVVNTPRGRGARADGYEIRRAALRRGVPAITTVAAAQAAVQAIEAAREGGGIQVTALQDLHPHLAIPLPPRR